MKKMSSIMHKRIILIVLFTLFLSSIFPIDSKGTKASHQPLAIPQISNSQKIYLSHEPIIITADNNFTDYGFPGLGTPENPHIIENFLVNTSQENAIFIKNTNKCFTIQNCFAIADKYGIYIENAGNNTVIISNNICSGNWQGIYVTTSKGVKIFNNMCDFNSDTGIRVDSCSYSFVVNNSCNHNYDGIIVYFSALTIIENNTCKDNESIGIWIWSTRSKSIANNNCERNSIGLKCSLVVGEIFKNICLENTIAGIYIDGSSESTISENNCSRNFYGIFNRLSLDVTIQSNTIIQNNYGLFLATGSFYNLIESNFCQNSSVHGIYLNQSKSCSIQNNKILDNKGHGVFLDEYSNDSLIAYNYFINNNPQGTSQGYDEGFGNNWYHVKNKCGNYWSDRKGRKYFIDGSADSVDKYPLNEQLERVSDLSFFWLSLSLLLLSLMSFRKKKFKKS